jgi:hypothetical protein
MRSYSVSDDVVLADSIDGHGGVLRLAGASLKSDRHRKRKALKSCGQTSPRLNRPLWLS